MHQAARHSLSTTSQPHPLHGAHDACRRRTNRVPVSSTSSLAGVTQDRESPCMTPIANANDCAAQEDVPDIPLLPQKHRLVSPRSIASTSFLRRQLQLSLSREDSGAACGACQSKHCQDARTVGARDNVRPSRHSHGSDPQLCFSYAGSTQDQELFFLSHRSFPLSTAQQGVNVALPISKCINAWLGRGGRDDDGGCAFCQACSYCDPRNRSCARQREHEASSHASSKSRQTSETTSLEAMGDYTLDCSSLRPDVTSGLSVACFDRQFFHDQQCFQAQETSTKLCSSCTRSLDNGPGLQSLDHLSSNAALDGSTDPPCPQIVPSSGPCSFWHDGPSNDLSKLESSYLRSDASTHGQPWSGLLPSVPNPAIESNNCSIRSETSVAQRVRAIEAKTAGESGPAVKPVFPLHLTRFQRRGSDGRVRRPSELVAAEKVAVGHQIIVSRDMPEHIQALIFEQAGRVDRVVVNSREVAGLSDVLKLIDEVAKELRLDIQVNGE